MSSARGTAHPALQACLGREEAAQDAVIPVLKVSSVCVIRAIFFFSGFGLARLEPYQLYYIVRELIPDHVYNTDRAHLKYLEFLRNTCKLFHSQIPFWYQQVCFLDKLKSKVDGWLFRLALDIAPKLPYHNNWQRHHFEFSVQVTQHRKIVLWRARAEHDGLDIVEAPEKAPNVVFELKLMRRKKDEVLAMMYMSKTGPPSVKGGKFAWGTLETVMATYKENFSKQLLAIKEEVEENEDNNAEYGSLDGDNCDLSPDHWDQLDRSSQDASQTVQESEIITIEDDVHILN
jgi:hypothetical protein